MCQFDPMSVNGCINHRSWVLIWLKIDDFLTYFNFELKFSAFPDFWRENGYFSHMLHLISYHLSPVWARSYVGERHRSFCQNGGPKISFSSFSGFSYMESWKFPDVFPMYFHEIYRLKVVPARSDNPLLSYGPKQGKKWPILEPGKVEFPEFSGENRHFSRVR